MLHAWYVAIPFTAASVRVPDSEPAPGLVPIATVMLPLKPTAVLPSPSRTVTFTAGAMWACDVAVVGCPVKTRVVAGAAVVVKGALVTPVSPAAPADRV